MDKFSVFLFSEMNDTSSFTAVKRTPCPFLKWNKQLKRFKSSEINNLAMTQMDMCKVITHWPTEISQFTMIINNLI